MNNSSHYFKNTECEYFPCHKNADKDNFNCLFCYCPLYHMKNCPGNSELFNGIKDCTNCTLPHTDYDAVISVLMEFFLNKVGITVKYKEEAKL